MKILLIEDGRFLRIAIERLLTKEGYSVTGVADGREGLQAARTSPPALILLDMMLPGLDGTSVLKALKQDESTAHIPVIVLTALSQINEEKLKDAGAAAYIEKSTTQLGGECGCPDPKSRKRAQEISCSEKVESQMRWRGRLVLVNCRTGIRRCRNIGTCINQNPHPRIASNSKWQPITGVMVPIDDKTQITQ